MSLTGRTRYREGWFGRLILQVEVDVTGSPLVSQMEPGRYAIWRDAKAPDFTPDHIRPMFRDAPMPYPGQRPPTER